MKYSKYVLILLLLSATSLRFYQLGETPSGFHRDEAFLGYNAYSLLKTGRDMSGHFLPTHLSSFVYTPAGYSYLSIIPISLLDLNVFSTRFTSAFFGSLTILVTYFLSREVFRKEKQSEYLALFSAFLVAFSPWHINLSRTASVSAVIVFFISLGVLFFFYWMKKQNLWFLTASFFLFSASLAFYVAPYSFLPLFVPLLFVIFFNEKHRKSLPAAAGLYLALIVLPLVLTIVSPNLSLRARSLSLTTSPGTNLILTDSIHRDGQEGTPLLVSRAFHNKAVLYGKAFMQNYFSHYSYSFLFTDQGLPDRYRVPLQGLLYFIELPFLLAGILMLLKQRSRMSIFLLGWLLLVPIGSSLTHDDVPNLQRTLFVYPALAMVVAYGFVRVLLFVMKKQVRYFFIGVIFLSFSYEVLFYLHQYYVHTSSYRPWYRQEGYASLVNSVNEKLPGYKKAIITNRESAPTIFFLFYGKYDPQRFQEDTRNSSMKDYDRIGFGKYEFSQEECPYPATETEKMKRSPARDVLYVNSGLCDVTPHATYLDEIHRSDDSTVFYILSSGKQDLD